MPISSITQVLLRLAALNWLFTSLLDSGLFFRASKSSISALVIPGILFLCGILCWKFAPLLSRLLTKGHDQDITLQGVSQCTLYSTAFVGLGLYFALGNFARIFIWLHYYLIYGSGNLAYAKPSSAYNIAEPILTFLAGVGLVATADIWARKLTSTKTCEQSGRE